MSAARFQRSERLLRSSDFKQLSQTGERVAGRHFVLLFSKKPPLDAVNSPRIGITVSRKVGNAVVRNRVKRRIREWFRARRQFLKTGDLIIIARPLAAALDTRATERALDELERRR